MMSHQISHLMSELPFYIVSSQLSAATDALIISLSLCILSRHLIYHIWSLTSSSSNHFGQQLVLVWSNMVLPSGREDVHQPQECTSFRGFSKCCQLIKENFASFFRIDFGKMRANEIIFIANRQNYRTNLSYDLQVNLAISYCTA